MMLRSLKYFQSVVRLNSFSAAAEENYISQSAISQQIQALERELGFPLLERRNRSFLLTPAGEYFYQKSLSLTADYERMCQEAQNIAQGGQSALHIGYLRCYTGGEFQRVLEAFSLRYPQVSVSVEYGNHEELYDMLRSGRADLVLNDQRRAFSEEYVNLVLKTCSAFVEVSAHSPLARLARISPQELKETACILVASPTQRETETEYYRTVVGLSGEFLYAENLEEARMMVIGRKGFLPVEGSGTAPLFSASIARIPLVRGGTPIRRTYCAFWKKENRSPAVTAFADLLRLQFADGEGAPHN